MAVNQIKLGGILSYVSLGVGNVLAIIYTPFLIRMMGQSEYGLYSLVLSVVAYLSLMDFGFGAALVRYITLYKSRNETEKLPSLLGMFISLYSVIGLICFLAGIGLYFSTDRIFGSSLTDLELEKARLMILIIAIYLSVTFPFSIFAAIITANEKFVFQKILAILRSVITPVLMIPLLFMGYKSVAMACVAVAVGILINIMNVWFCYSKIKIKISFKNFDYPLLREIFWFSLFVFLKIILERIYWSSGQFILGATVGTIAVAIFSVALQMKGYYESFSQAIGNLFLPRLTSMIGQKDSERLITETFVKVGRIQFHIIGFILCVYFLIGEKFIVLWAGQNYISAYEMSLFIMVPYTIPLIQSLGYLLVQAYNIQKPLIIIFLITTVLTISLSFLLIESYGAKGCAMALAVAIVVGEVLIMNWFYWKKLKIDIPLFWREIAKILAVMVLVTASCSFFISFFRIESLYSLVFYVACFAVIYFPLIYFVAMNAYEKNLVLSFFNVLKLRRTK
jgi:O-antigen/teichoic acid export membrane protein